MLAGTLTFTGCVWLENTLFGVESGAGLVRPQKDAPRMSNKQAGV